MVPFSVVGGVDDAGAAGAPSDAPTTEELPVSAFGAVVAVEVEAETAASAADGVSSDVIVSCCRDRKALVWFSGSNLSSTEVVEVGEINDWR